VRPCAGGYSQGSGRTGPEVGGVTGQRRRFGVWTIVQSRRGEWTVKARGQQPQRETPNLVSSPGWGPGAPSAGGYAYSRIAGSGGITTSVSPPWSAIC